jgi:hypothetical protein
MKKPVIFALFTILALYFLSYSQDQHNFSTGKEVLTVVAFGDPQAITYDHLKENVVKPGYERAMALNPDLMIIAGDMNEHGETMHYWDTLESVLKATGVPYETPNTLFYPVHGDHDQISLGGMTDWNARWVNRFDLPGNETYYSFRRNNVFFIALSYPSNISSYSKSVQYTWCESELIKASNNPEIDWIYVYFHDPLVWEDTNFGKLFTKYGVNLVHHGDKHLHYHSHPVRFEESGSGPVITNAPGQGLVVFESGITIIGPAPSNYYPKFTATQQGVLKLEFKGKILKASSYTRDEGRLFSMWTRLSLRNNQVTYDNLKLSAEGNVPLNGTLQLKAEAGFSDGTVTDITDRAFCKFTSLDPGLATVSSSGLVTGRAEGQARIVARSIFDWSGSGSFDKSDTITLNVMNDLSIDYKTPVSGLFTFSCLPNPCRFRTHIRWTDRSDGLSIYSVAGKLIKHVIPATGQRSYVWNVKDIKPGVYFIRISIDRRQFVKKLLVVR